MSSFSRRTWFSCTRVPGVGDSGDAVGRFLGDRGGDAVAVAFASTGRNPPNAVEPAAAFTGDFARFTAAEVPVPDASVATRGSGDGDVLRFRVGDFDGFAVDSLARVVFASIAADLPRVVNDGAAAANDGFVGVLFLFFVVGVAVFFAGAPAPVAVAVLDGAGVGVGVDGGVFFASSRRRVSSPRRRGRRRGRRDARGGDHEKGWGDIPRADRLVGRAVELTAAREASGPRASAPREGTRAFRKRRRDGANSHARKIGI
jgi:hypothetical protein